MYTKNQSHMMYGSWDIKCKVQRFFVILGHCFCPLTLQQPKKSKFWKNKKMHEDIIILHLCTTNENHDWCMVPDISSKTDRQVFVILDYFLPFYSLTMQKIKILRKWEKLLEILSFTQVYRKWQSYDIWFLRYQLQQTDFFCHLWPFFSFYAPNSPKDENIKKLKNTPGDIIISHKCTKNHDHMLYCPWDMAHDAYNCCFSFWAIFSPFTPLPLPLTAQKTKFQKNEIMHISTYIIMLYMCTKNYD